MDPIFKGATRPAMVLGIPLLPLIICCMTGLLLSIWSLLLLGQLICFLTLACNVTLLLYMRIICKHDDQKLHQLMLQLQSKSARRNIDYWGCQSSSPHDYTLRKHPWIAS